MRIRERERGGGGGGGGGAERNIFKQTNVDRETKTGGSWTQRKIGRSFFLLALFVLPFIYPFVFL